MASLMLVVISVLAKMASVYAFPPAPGLSRRQALSVGALLQCKGLMEIVAATILHAQGMLSDFAFASLMVLAVISTALTGPLFRLFAPRTRAGGNCARSALTPSRPGFAPQQEITGIWRAQTQSLRSGSGHHTDRPERVSYQARSWRNKVF